MLRMPAVCLTVHLCLAPYPQGRQTQVPSETADYTIPQVDHDLSAQTEGFATRYLN